MAALRAKAAVPVEIRGSGRRVFRLSAAVGEDGVELSRRAPFEIGRPVEISFGLPGGQSALVLRATVAFGSGDHDDGGENGGRELAFIDPPAEARRDIHRYVTERTNLDR